MNHPSLSKKAFRARQNRRGIALLIVLSSIILLTLIVIAFLINGTSELRTSAAYANGSSVKLLAQSAVNVVLAEINDATHDAHYCWASEPGMIRSYDNTGAAYKYYKLYSDDGMIGAGAFNPFGTSNGISNVVPTNWDSQKGVYVDLNEPISVGTAGTRHYPIVDGDPNDLSLIATDASGAKALTYGQPTNSNLAQVAGFWVEPSPTTPVSSSASVPNEAPMPVKWLYVLKNGQVIVPDSNNGSSTVTFKGTPGLPAQPAPSATNPIVGRMAFWTDDESCKVNINTASESAQPGTVKNTNGASSLTGSFIDTPRVCSAFDESMAIYPAVQNEFQRYPGHPATISLSSVFQDWTGDSNYPESIYALTPRTNNGGSYEGGVQYASQSAAGTTAKALPLRSDRLYSTVDEFLFQPNRTPNTSANSSSPSLDVSGTKLSSNNPLDGPALEKARFFLTASSRAPDLNLFNLPRVCMWPVSQYNDSQHRTAYDNLIAFCETLGAPATAPAVNNNIYYFQRGDPLINAGKGWESQTENVDIGRNNTLLTYLQTLCGEPIPGFGGYIPATGANGATNTFLGKYPQDRDQILTEIFDYIRCTNLHDTSMVSAVPSINFHYFSNTVLTPTASNVLNPDDGVVMPTLNALSNGTKGFGRFPTVSGAGVIFIASAVGPKPPGPVNAPGTNTNDLLTQSIDAGSTLPPSASEPTLQPGYTRVQAALVFSLFDPSQGFFGANPNVILQVIPNLTWDAGGIVHPTPYQPVYFGQPKAAGLPSGPAGTFYIYAGNSILTSQPPWGGELGLQYGLGGYGNGGGKFPDYPLATGLPFMVGAKAPATTGTLWAVAGAPGNGLPDYAPGTKIHLEGNVTVNVYLGQPTISTRNGIGMANTLGGLIQTITFSFPGGGTFPVPAPVTGESGNGTVTYNGITTCINSFNSAYYATAGGFAQGPGRLYLGSTAQYPYPILPGDTVESLVSANGDLRLTAATQNVNSNSGAFVQHPLYGQQMAHSFMEPNGLVYYGATRGQLAPGIAQYWVGGATGAVFTYAPFTYNANPAVATNNTSQATFTCEPEGFANIFSGSPTTSLSNTGVLAGGGATGAPGDWDNGTGVVRDGPYINKPDEGDIGAATGTSSKTLNYPAYFSNTYNTASGSTRGLGTTGAAYFSPARIMPSAGMLGSLPTGVMSNHPWQTLLFHPDEGLGHPGAASPPDYLMLDLFHMPVVEPYAISEPLSTAGRINMNYLMVPFTYINRDTGIRAVLQSQQILSIPNSAAYGSGTSNGAPTNSNPVSGAYKQLCSQNNFSPNFFTGNTATYRFPVNINETMKGFMARFNGAVTGTPDIFRSAAEICSLDLVPNDGGASFNSMLAYWKNHALTGDNSREKPYANIYPLLTTKSNTFTIHFRVQTLKKVNPSGPNGANWQEGTDVVTAEYRGSQTIERYINPSDANLSGTSGDFAATTPTPDKNIIPSLYQFRTVSSTQFAP